LHTFSHFHMYRLCMHVSEISQTQDRRCMQRLYYRNFHPLIFSFSPCATPAIHAYTTAPRRAAKTIRQLVGPFKCPAHHHLELGDFHEQSPADSEEDDKNDPYPLLLGMESPQARMVRPKYMQACTTLSKAAKGFANPEVPSKVE